MRNSSTSRDGRLGRQRLFFWAIAALALLCFAAKLYAVDPRRLLSQYSRDRWDSDKGFPGGSVTAIAQTSDGYLWIGTDKGLIRFDGLNFRIFQKATPGTLPIGPVQALVADAEGNLWILLQSTNILRYHDGTFELGHDEAEFGITAIGRRRNGTVLLSSLVYGALTYTAGKFQVLASPRNDVPASQTASPGAYDDLSSRLSWATSVAAHRLAEPSSAVASMAETSDGKVWLGTRDKGLFYMLGGHVSPAEKEQSSSAITCVLPVDGANLWIGTENGVLLWNGANLTQTGVPPSLRQSRIFAMIRDHDSNIWVGTAEGLLRVNGHGLSLDGDHSATSEPVTALFEDREGNLWVGRPRGIERLRESAFITYSTASLQSESSGPIYVDEEGRAWFAPFEGGLHWLQDGRTGTVTNDHLSDDVVYSITGSKNELWIGRQRGGLTRLRSDEKTFTTITYTEADGLAQNGVYAVYLSRDGSVWAATLSGGVSQYKDDRFKTYTTANGMTSNTVASIAETPDGTMWFATPNGLDAFSHGQWRAFTSREGLPTDNVNSVLSDSQGVLWIGTASGLAFRKSGRIELPKDGPPSLHEQILGLAEDKNDRLWIATSYHVLSAKRDALLGGQLGDADVRDYGLDDGLHGTEGVKRDHSVFADSFGRVWFSMNRGLSVVDTERTVGSSAPAIVQIEGLSEDGKSIDLLRPLRIPSGGRRFTFNYSGLSLSVPERVRFKYKLDGFDQHWSEPVSSREAIYTNLGPGAYTFRVMASNSEGVWNETGATLDFRVPPAWFQTSWFRILCALFILSIALALYRLRVRQIAKAISTRFDERLAERTRIARDLHDTFLQTVQGSKLVADDALEQSTDPVRMRRAMEQLSVWLGQATQEGRAALNSLRTSTTERNDLAEALRRATDNGHLPPTMTVTFSVIGDSREMHPIVRDEVYRIGFEAIRNASVHSKASQLEIELNYTQNLAVLVRDNGVGIPPAVTHRGKPGHFGLQGMRERAARIGGKLTVVSSATSGTEVRLLVPGGIIFRKSSHFGRALLAKLRRSSLRGKDQTPNLD